MDSVNSAPAAAGAASLWLYSCYGLYSEAMIRFLRRSVRQATPARVAVLVEQMYEELEVWYPALRLREAGHEVVFVGPKAGEAYKGKYGYPATSDLALCDAAADDFDAVVVPGGFAPDYLRRDPHAVPFVRAMWDQKKIVAAICHGVWLPASAEIVKGKRVTSFFAIKDDVVHAGGKWEDAETVRDGNLITARKPSDLPFFTKTLVDALAER